MLRRVAARYMQRERKNHTLQPTALVNEAYVRLVQQPALNPHNRNYQTNRIPKLNANVRSFRCAFADGLFTQSLRSVPRAFAADCPSKNG